MKTTTLSLIISASVAVLVVAILLQKPKSQKKEGFVANLIEEDWKVSLGVGVGIGVAGILLIVFLVYLFSQPKKYNAANVPVGRRWAVPYNME